MAVFNHEAVVPSSIAPAKLFKAFVLDAGELAPTIFPEFIKSVETLEGDGGAGTITVTTFSKGFLKQRVDVLDKENFTFNYTIIEGLPLADKFESISSEVKISASADGGSICKITSKYHPKADAEITQEEVNEGGGRVVGVLKAIEGYLLANADA